MTSWQSGVALAAILLVFGGVTCGLQWRGRRSVAARQHVPSDELLYLTRRYRRRFATGLLLSVIGLMIGTAFLSGMERRADVLADPPAVAEAEVPRVPVPEGDRQFVKFWGVYWIVVLLLVFTLLGLAFTDALATRRYWLSQFQHIREDHQVKLRRDLAIFRQQKDQSRFSPRSE